MYKFSLPQRDMNPSEASVWDECKAGRKTALELRRRLVHLRDEMGVDLTLPSAEVVAQDISALSDLEAEAVLRALVDERSA